MLHPNYRVEVGSEEFSPGSQCAVSFAARLGLGPKVDSFNITFVSSDRPSKIMRYDDVKVYLGYEDDLVKVFSGYVNTVDRDFSRVRVGCLSWAANFLWLKVNRVYVNQTSGQMVSDLISALRERLDGTKLVPVGEGEIMDGRTFPVYVIDDRCNVYEHIGKLAERSNFVFYTSSDNTLYFKKYERRDEHVLKYGSDIIRIDMLKNVGPFGTVSVYGESPSGWAGRETYHWLTKKEVVGVSSKQFLEGQKDVSGAHTFAVQDYAVKDSDTVAAVSESVSSRVNRRLEVTLKIVGDPKIEVNDSLKVEGLDGFGFNPNLRVTDVEHYLDKVDGFTSIVTCLEEDLM